VIVTEYSNNFQPATTTVTLVFLQNYRPQNWSTATRKLQAVCLPAILEPTKNKIAFSSCHHQILPAN